MGQTNMLNIKKEIGENENSMMMSIFFIFSFSTVHHKIPRKFYSFGLESDFSFELHFQCLQYWSNCFFVPGFSIFCGLQFLFFSEFQEGFLGYYYDFE